MKPVSFYGILAAIIVILVAGIKYFATYENLEGESLAYSGIIVFSLLCISFYVLTRYLSSKSAEKAYMNLIFMNFLIKFVIVILIPLVYYLENDVMTSNFILPYIIVYIVFTVFETAFMSKNVRMRKGR